MIGYSYSPDQQEFDVRPKTLVDRMKAISKRTAAGKKTKVSDAVWDYYMSIVTGLNVAKRDRVQNKRVAIRKAEVMNNFRQWLALIGEDGIEAAQRKAHIRRQRISSFQLPTIVH